MRILICSDGMPGSSQAVRIGALLAGASKADAVLLGVAEQPSDESDLNQALEKDAENLRAAGVNVKIVAGAGDPIREILRETTANPYDLVVLGAEQKGYSGLYWRSQTTYEVIKAIAPPVLVAMGECARLKRFLVCTGGREFIEEGLQLTGKLASALGASVTLLHVLAEPPAMYADLMQLEEDVERLLQSKSELGLNLKKQKESLAQLGVPAMVRIRHGIVVDEVFAEARESEPDLIVTGSSRARGLVRHYIMGDLTRSILNRAECPVLVARGGEPRHRGILERLKARFVGSD